MKPKKNDTQDQLFAQLVIAAVGLEFGIPHTLIDNRTKGTSRAAFGRQLAMYLLNVVYDVNLSRVARVFNRDRSTASHACHVIEDQREDPMLDAKICRLETFLTGAPRPHMGVNTNPASNGGEAYS